MLCVGILRLVDSVFCGLKLMVSIFWLYFVSVVVRLMDVVVLLMLFFWLYSVMMWVGLWDFSGFGIGNLWYGWLVGFMGVLLVFCVFVLDFVIFLVICFFVLLCLFDCSGWVLV